MPLLRLKNPSETPRGYWRYPRHHVMDGERYAEPINDGNFITGGDLQNLVYNINEYRVTNSLPLGDANAEAQDWLCRTSGARCVPAVPVEHVPGRKARAVDVARFLWALAAWMKTTETVSQEEADRRAEICIGCPFNVPVDDTACWGCFNLTARIMRVIGNRRTRFDEGLKFCGLCGCSNVVSAFVPLSVLGKAHKLEEFPADIGNGAPCWKRRV